MNLGGRIGHHAEPAAARVAPALTLLRTLV